MRISVNVIRFDLKKKMFHKIILQLPKAFLILKFNFEVVVCILNV